MYSTEMQKYLQEYGTKGLSLIVAKFIELAPEFPGDKELADELGRATADLQSALESLR